MIGAPWLDAQGLLAETRGALADCGIGARTVRYRPSGGPCSGQALDGVFLTLENEDAYLPATAGARLFAAISRRHHDELANGSRPEWIDKLTGSSKLREALDNPDALDALLAGWREACGTYLERERVVLYPRKAGD